jgi:mono/diheme cytochrome c family protein
VSTYLAPILATAEAEPTGPSNVGLGSIVLTIAVGVFLVWVGYVVINSRRRTRPPETPAPNQEFYMDNAGLENDRLTRVLTAAVIAAAVLAIVMPIYFVNESNRQEAAAAQIDEEYVHLGSQWWVNFSCTGCHGPDAGGGGAAITEARSGLDANWSVPSLNDVFYRYDESEVRHWITYGRAGTPMPANGLDGGGAMTIQEIDQVVAYLYSLQISQAAAVAKTDGLVETALNRMANAEDTISTRILVEQTTLDDILDGPRRFSVIETMPDDIDSLLSGAGTCTDESAALVGTTCPAAGVDTDRDGLTDEAETALTEVAQRAFAEITTHTVNTSADPPEVTVVEDANFDVTFDPAAAYSMTDTAGNPLADLDAADTLITHVDAKHLELSLLNERYEQFADPVRAGIDFLNNALEERAWEVDYAAVADATGLTEDEAMRAAGLFNSYCARCHTAGYSAGVEFEQEPGSGAWAPALTQGRTIVQFPVEQDHIDFVINGAEAATEYGVNGISQVGGMPGFGAVLSMEDIELIVKYERSL